MKAGKIIIVHFVIPYLLFSCNTASNGDYYTLNINDIASKIKVGQKIYIKRVENGQYLLADSFVMTGTGPTFTVKKRNKNPFMAILSTNDQPFLSKMFIVTNTNIDISIAKNQVSGGENKYMAENFPLFSLPYSLRSKALMNFNTLYERAVRDIKFKDKVTEEEFQKYQYSILQTTKENRSIFFVLYQLDFYHRNISLQTLEKCLSIIDPKLKSTAQYNHLISYLQRAKGKQIGDSILNASYIDLNKKQFLLKDLLRRKKYTVIDFWASWCGPCRKEFKQLVGIGIDKRIDTNKVQFVIFSCDISFINWNRASIEENIKWLNISDLKGFGINGLANSLAVEAIPKIMVIDDHGLIIDKKSISALIGPLIDLH